MVRKKPRTICDIDPVTLDRITRVLIDRWPGQDITDHDVGEWILDAILDRLQRDEEYRGWHHDQADQDDQVWPDEIIGIPDHVPDRD